MLRISNQCHQRGSPASHHDAAAAIDLGLHANNASLRSAVDLGHRSSS